ncbi:glycosyltransferase family 4 protein [Dokdonella fugitiva]|jgi:sugar transferase (PEP-CTERM/EpsH1 system associated)|uniref:Sugar transferase (PEP-CTERM/EpsH1 system associated) n=1 Tax=Dokdonella fugitiva TaxID=328517 RepID=A0A4R2IG35_9GAMM|nr:glycosyltransferase family 4 protein [Dokdonella fugitiva]MBA8882855.1 sugar transferase (PEP-CTERM/EpsH1 system associated) [Dokdonella fugitiva]TCO43172.1 sugar transferase (PEP-CTERM/EpsH1 system associated) [Dokdonella fugitiva]
MRVLFLTSRFPGDLRSGDRRRAYEQLRLLAPTHAITLLTFDDRGGDPGLRRQVFELCERVILVPRDRLGMLARAALALPRALPLQVALYAAPALRKALHEACGDAAFDLVHLQLSRLGTFAPVPHGVPCVVDFVDALSLNMARRAHYDRGPMGLVARLEARRLARYERALCGRIAAGAVSSARDLAALGEPGNVRLVHNGVDPAEFPFSTAPRDDAAIAFVGNLGYFPNVDAALWFASRMPRIRAARPAAELRLVGARPAARLHRLAARVEGVRVIGPVERVHPHLARAAVAIAPMRAGSGQQLKILEAMATGTPVVATRDAAAAIDAVPGRDLLAADDPDDFADAVLRVLGDRELATTLARNGGDFVERRYSWRASAQALEQVWREAAGAPTRPGAATAG